MQALRVVGDRLGELRLGDVARVIVADDNLGEPDNAKIFGDEVERVLSGLHGFLRFCQDRS